MKESTPTPTLDEFLAACDAECAFLIREYGFERLAEPLEYNRFSVRFRKGAVEVHVYGESWGQTASCDLVRGGDLLPLALIVPAAERGARIAKGPGTGQLAKVREIAARLRRHAAEFLAGDNGRFDPALAEWRRITTRRPITEAVREERARAQAVTVAGHAFKRADFAEVVRLLEPHAGSLSAHQRKMLELARDRLSSPSG